MAGGGASAAELPAAADASDAAEGPLWLPTPNICIPRALNRRPTRRAALTGAWARGMATRTTSGATIQKTSLASYLSRPAHCNGMPTAFKPRLMVKANTSETAFVASGSATWYTESIEVDSW